jgi:superfamily I DNA/RNA helicase
VKLTPQQEDIIKFIQNPEGHAVVEARAGTGKTTILTLGAQGTIFPIIATAFNTAITKVLEEKMPENVVAKGLNSLGFGSLFKNLATKPVLDEKKRYKIQKSMGMKQEFPDLPRAFAIAKAWGIAPRGTVGNPVSLTPDDQETYEKLFGEYAIDTGFCQNPVGVLRQALINGTKLAFQGQVDFDDQLYIPALYDFVPRKADMVMIDEAQDVNKCQRKLAALMLSTGASLIAVGDRHQAIYGFRGADRQSIPSIIKDFDATVLPMTVSFRCPQQVVLEAKKLVPDIQLYEHAIEGKVESLKEFSPDDLVPGCAILCRNNKPIISLCMELLKRKIPATIRGRDIGQSIAKLLKDTKEDDLHQAVQVMWQQVEKRMATLIAKDQSEAAGNLNDRAECATIIAEQMPQHSTVDEFEKYINQMYSDDLHAPIILSTVHRAKGLEWNDVYILDKYLMPSKWAKTDEDKAQESNIEYVAVTRSKCNLTYIYSSGLK